MKFLRARLGRRGSIGAVLVALLITPQLASAQTKAATVLRAAYLKSLSFSPLFLALEKKYFEEEGLTIELDTVQSASDVVAFLGMGRLDLAFGNIGAPLINAGERDINVRVVAATSYYPADGATLSPAPVIVRKQLADAGPSRRWRISEVVRLPSIREAGLSNISSAARPERSGCRSPTSTSSPCPFQA